MKRTISLLVAVLFCLSSLYIPVYAVNKDFKDVNKNDWFYSDVQKLVEMEAISGFSDGSFKPQDSITRAEFVKILISSLNIAGATTDDFTDTKNHWAKQFISAAVAKGVIEKSEYGNSFQPDKPIDRMEMAKMLLRALKVSPSEGKASPFVDSNDRYTTAAYDEYLIMGSVNGDGRYFYPYNNATRAEASAIVVRAVEYKADAAEYKAKKEKELQDSQPAVTDLTGSLGDVDEDPDVQIEDVTELPDEVSVYTPAELSEKIMTAIYLKKDAITLQISNYNENDYSFDQIGKYVALVNFEKCYQNGYCAACQVRVSYRDSSAEMQLQFNYSELDQFDVSGLKKIRSIDTFMKVIKAAILNKETSITVAIKDYDPQVYEIGKAVSVLNDEEVLQRGYYAFNCGGGHTLGFSNTKIMNINLKFIDLDFNYPNISKVNSYEDFISAISNNVKSKKTKFNIAIQDYDSEKYNLGNILEDLNTNQLSKEGYYAKVLYKDVKDTNPAILSVCFEYPASGGSTSSTENTDLPVLKSSKEWYAFIKTALENFQEVLKYNETYSVDFGDSIKLVLAHNPDLNYIDHYSYTNGTINFIYKYPKEKLTEINNNVHEKASQVIAQIIDTNMSEIEKAKAIHDYIVVNTKYDYENYQNGTVPQESYTAYGVLVNGTGVCQGYSATFNLLAKMVGIKSIGVSGEGNGGAHAWNMVMLDGKVGYIDVTWDDPVPDRGDEIGYNYFNISQEQIGENHKWDKEMFSGKYLEY